MQACKAWVAPLPVLAEPVWGHLIEAEDVASGEWEAEGMSAPLRADAALLPDARVAGALFSWSRLRWAVGCCPSCSTMEPSGTACVADFVAPA